MKSYTVIIISVGDELLQGKVQDTNSTTIAAQLSLLGITPTRVITIPDNLEALASEVATASSECDCLLITGGLGPTLDDATREGVAQGIGKKLLFQEDLWERIQERYPHSVVPEVNKRQAYLIEGGEALPNEHGTAPGMWITLPKERSTNRKEPTASTSSIGLLPGPPREMIPMFLEQVLPRISASVGTLPPRSTIWRLYGAGESSIAEIIESFKIPHGCYTKDGWIEIQILHPPEGLSQGLLTQLQEALHEQGILQTEDKPLPLLALEKLKKAGLTVAFAESLTGGDVAAAMVEHPGASRVFLGSIVAYSNQLKENILMVPKKVLTTYGAVSRETARAMAQGARTLTGADITLSVTGIAGPDGGSAEKPIGTVWMGVSTPKESREKMVVIRGNRERIRQKTVQMVYQEILESLTCNE